MSIFHLNAKVISRGQGQSAIAAAAYRSGDRLRDEQAGELKHYRARSERIHFTGIIVPANAPAWANDRNSLWNEAERGEKRKDAQLAREIEVALPHELTAEQREWLVKDFAREAFVRKGYGVDIAIHAPDKDSDGRNHHAHIMVTMRRLGREGFEGDKDRSLNGRAQLGEWREQWAHLANRHLERHGHAERIDHRSLADRGIEREPGVHLGYAANEIERRGRVSERGDELRGVLARNNIRVQMTEIDAELKALEIADAKAKAEALLALERVAQADERALKNPVAQAYAQGAHEVAQEVPQERNEAPAEKAQEAWRESVADTPRPAKPRESDGGLKVAAGVGGVVMGVADFVVGLLAGAAPSTQPGKAADPRAFLTDPVARREQQRARVAAIDAAERDRKALARINDDMKAGKNLNSSDIRSLTRAHQEQIRDHGDDALRQMVDEAQRYSERYWKGEGRERD